MQNDFKIIALYVRGLFYRFDNPRGGIRLNDSLLIQEMLRRRVLAPHPLDDTRGILTLRGERCAKDIVHKLIRPLLYIIFSALLALVLFRS